MNALKMVFVWVVSIVFLFIKKLGAQKSEIFERRISIYKQKLSLPGDTNINTSEDLVMN